MTNQQRIARRSIQISAKARRSFKTGVQPKPCRVCGKLTTGPNDNIGDDICNKCWDDAGWDNAHSDGYHDADRDGFQAECKACVKEREAEQAAAPPVETVEDILNELKASAADKEAAYMAGHQAGWNSAQPNAEIPVEDRYEYIVGPLAAEYAEGYKDGLAASARIPEPVAAPPVFTRRFDVTAERIFISYRIEGLGEVATLYYEARPYEYGSYGAPKATVNWSGCGAQSISTTRAFATVIEAAAADAEKMLAGVKIEAL